MRWAGLKRIVSFTVIVASLTVVLCGCSIINPQSSSNDKTDELCSTIISSIEENNQDNLKKLFSEEALKKCTDFDEGFEYTVNEYKGSLINMKPVSYTEDAHFDKGKHSIESRALYSIETTEKTYYLYMYFYPSNTIEPTEEGLYRIILLDNRAEKSYDQYAGIYNPKWDVEE